MIKRTKKKNFKFKRKQNNVFRFSVVSLLLIFSFFSLPTINNFLDKNLNFKKSVISNAGINFDQELNKRKKILDGEKETKTKNKSELSKIVAEKLAKKAQEKKIIKIYFDRGIYKYHGRIKIFAETLRKNGMEF